MEGGRPAKGRDGILSLGSDPLVGWALGPSQKGRELGGYEHKCFWAWGLQSVRPFILTGFLPALPRG